MKLLKGLPVIGKIDSLAKSKHEPPKFQTVSQSNTTLGKPEKVVAVGYRVRDLIKDPV